VADRWIELAAIGIHPLAFGIDCHQLRIGTRLELSAYRKRRSIDHIDDITIAGGDIDLLGLGFMIMPRGRRDTGIVLMILSVLLSRTVTVLSFSLLTSSVAAKTREAVITNRVKAAAVRVASLASVSYGLGNLHLVSGWS